MKYAVAKTDDADLRPHMDALRALEEQLRQQQKFMEDRAKQLVEAAKSSARKEWDAIHDALKARGVLPEGFNHRRDDHSIGVDGKTVYARMGSDGSGVSPSFEAFIRTLLRQ